MKSLIKGIESPTHVYAGGYCYYSGVQVAGYWKDGSWAGLPSSYYSTLVTSVVVSGSNVYAGGVCYNGSGVPAAG